MDITIRKAQLEDFKTITQLSQQLGYNVTDEDTHARLTELLYDNNHCVYVAIAEGKIAGWIHGCYSLRIESGKFIEIGGLVIDEGHRRIGIGKILVEKIIEWSATKKCEKIRVRSNVKRKSAHEFYKNLGFIESKEQKVYSKSN